ncbi:MAG: FHA domain-containing protein, partial [Oscillospiraceae bacterium]
LFGQQLKKGVFLKILCSIAEVMLRAEEYMIDDDKFILEDNYIFVDSGSLEVSLLLIPTNKPYGKSFRTFVKNCIVSCVFDLSEDNAYPTQINNFLNSDPNAGVKQIYEFLDKMLSGAAPAQPINMGRPAVQQAPAGAPAANKQPVFNPAPAAAPAAAPAVNVPPAQPAQQPAMGIPNQNANQANEKKSSGGIFSLFDKKEKKQQSAPMGGMAVPGAKPANGMAIPGAKPASGMAIPGANPANGMAVPGAKPSSGMAVPGAKPANGMAIPGAKPAGGMLKKQPAQQPLPQPAQPVQPMQPVQPVMQAELAQETQFINRSEATVLLGANAAQGGAVASAYLESPTQGSHRIDKDSYFIGKGTNTSIVNSLVIRNENVSRNHAVVERVGSEYFIKDNNSMNGTYLNGTRINPNTRYPLASGAKIVFANEEFTFVIK